MAKKVGKDLDTTEALVKALVVPLARSKAGRLRLYDFCPVQHRGLPHYYIAHSWSDSFHRVLEQTINHALVTRPAVPAPPSSRSDSPALWDSALGEDLGQLSRAGLSKVAQEKQAGSQRVLESTYVWLDVCAISQHPWTAATPAVLNIDEVRSSIMAAQLGTLFVVHSDLDVLQRCWCMYEVWATVYYGSCERLTTLFHEDMTLEDLILFQEECAVMELVGGYTTKPADKQRIVAEVKHRVGLRRMQQLLPDSLMRSARATLRWSGNMGKVSMYCALLIKLREWYQVQTVLHSIPELHDDQQMLQEIRGVFKMYDTDGSGELCEEEFVEVLGLAGFSKDESKDIFALVDVDNGGGVGLEEFEMWWIESQRQQSTRHTKPVTLTVTALVTNLTAMVALLERTGFNDHVPFYKTAITTLQKGPSFTLIPLPVKGDWHEVAQQVAWKASAKDYRGACKLIYGLLFWNADALTADPATLADPEATQGAIPLLKLLCGAMEDFGALMKTVPTNHRESEYFYKAASELREHILEPLLDHEAELLGLPVVKKKKPGVLASLGIKSTASTANIESSPTPPHRSKSVGQGLSQGLSPQSSRDSSSLADQSKHKAGHKAKPNKQKSELFPSKFEIQRDALVSDMVKLKYGQQTLITPFQLVEAEKSLSTWMAAQKSLHGKGMKQSDRNAVVDFSSSYLTTGSVALPSLPSGGLPPLSDRGARTISGFEELPMRRANIVIPRSSSCVSLPKL